MKSPITSLERQLLESLRWSIRQIDTVMVETEGAANQYDAAVELIAKIDAGGAPPPLRKCGYCHAWQSHPCGEGCHWDIEDPTYGDFVATT